MSSKYPVVGDAIEANTTNITMTSPLHSERLHKAYTFLGCLGLIMFILMLVYICIARRLCCCQKDHMKPRLRWGLLEAVSMIVVPVNEEAGGCAEVEEVVNLRKVGDDANRWDDTVLDVLLMGPDYTTAAKRTFWI